MAGVISSVKVHTPFLFFKLFGEYF